MQKLVAIIGAAALAIGAPSAAKPGGGGGGDKPEKQQEGGGKPQKVEQRTGGEPRAKHGGSDREARDAGPARKAERAFAGHEPGRDPGAKPGKAAKAPKFAPAKGERVSYARSGDKLRKPELKREQGYRADVLGTRSRDRDLARAGPAAGRGLVGGCPPGLTNKNAACLPPGQANKIFGIGELLPAASFGGYNLPSEYRDWYQESPDYSYRYDDSGYIYGMDKRSGLIDSLIPLLGGGFGIGGVLPAGYDTYNLPFPYRDDYADSDDAAYRYGDDAIYQVDPKTQVIEAVVALLGGDLNVGQMLPSGYDAYNLPLDYRDRYQDSDEALYRYGDGNIYQVDAKTQLITAIIDAIA